MIFEVNRQDFRATQIAPATPIDLKPGQVRLAVERWAFTTNNITYAVAGDMLDYWGFFPTDAPWGRIPGIGLGSVVESANPDIAVGGRYFGFYPMGSEHIVTAKPHGPDGFRDAGAHRANHAVTYTDFRNVEADDTFDVDKADEYLLLWGMFMTSFLVDDMLGDTDFSGAVQTLVTSASSKTSISLASCLAGRNDSRSVGLTSQRNRSFVEGLGLYDQVITYDEVDQLDASVASGVVDMAGNAAVRAAIHNHFDDSLRFSTSVGMTHWDAQQSTGQSGNEALPGPAPEFFFAPSQRAKRVKEWGAEELDDRIDKAFSDLLAGTKSWLQVEHRQGPEAIETTYRDLLEGRAEPSAGFVCSMHEEPLV